jgi:trehalose-6-phosphate synthase|tara:strand:- start:1867 stop:3150 length:1284 start_codon:yes stop_codon:yes gene_type:complete
LSGVPTSPSSPAAGRTRSSSALRDDLLQAQTEAGAERRWDSDESIVGDMPPSLEEHAILSRIHQLHREWEERRSESARGASSPESSAAAASKGEAQQERLVIVSNRLPVKVVRDPKTNEWNFRVTSGGLVTALSGMRGSMDFVWIGWLECDMPAEEQPAFAQRLLAEHGCLPVFLPKEVSDGFYNGFSNDVLWPLFHYVPLVVHVEGASEAKSFNPQHWAAYQRANRMFADVVTPLLREGDMVWVHDYHLTLLPRLLKELGPPSLTIGWFLHIPWPTSEVYRYLPVKTEILEGLLHADLVGFHTYDYARHFQSCCRRFLSARCVPRGIEYGGQVIDLGVFPIGIDPEGFESRVREPATQSRLMELINGHKLKGKQVFLSVGRVDYIKGVPHRLAAFNLFLQRYPQYWQEERVVLIEIAIPTRQGEFE